MTEASVFHGKERRRRYTSLVLRFALPIFFFALDAGAWEGGSPDRWTIGLGLDHTQHYNGRQDSLLTPPPENFAVFQGAYVPGKRLKLFAEFGSATGGTVATEFYLGTRFAIILPGSRYGSRSFLDAISIWLEFEGGMMSLAGPTPPRAYQEKSTLFRMGGVLEIALGRKAFFDFTGLTYQGSGGNRMIAGGLTFGIFL